MLSYFRDGLLTLCCCHCVVHICILYLAVSQTYGNVDSHRTSKRKALFHNFQWKKCMVNDGVPQFHLQCVQRRSRAFHQSEIKVISSWGIWYFSSCAKRIIDFVSHSAPQNLFCFCDSAWPARCNYWVGSMGVCGDDISCIIIDMCYHYIGPIYKPI